jgi:branched-chain amino acid transport system substrate-binding protein
MRTSYSRKHRRGVQVDTVAGPGLTTQTMRTRISRRIVLLAFAGVVASACGKQPSEQPAAPAEKPAAADNEIRIGVVGALTGPIALFGTNTRNGIDLAVKQVNASGGVLGKQVKAIHLDDQGKPEEAKTAIQRLITQDKVQVVLGEVTSSGSLAMGPVAQRAKIPMITPASTNPAVTEVGDFIFRVCFIDPFQGWVMAKFAAENLKLKKVAILQDVRNDYSVGLANSFTKHFTEMGGQVVANESFAMGDTDYKTQLTKIRGMSPQAIYIPAYYTEVGQIARQARELKIEAQLLGGDGWDSEKLFEGGGKAVEGAYFSNHYHPDEPRPEVRAFLDAFKQDFNEEAYAITALGYDAAMVAFDAIKRAGSTDPQKIRDALAATKGYPGVTGSITIDAGRNAQKPAVITQIKDGKRTLVTQIVDPKMAKTSTAP